MEIWHLCLFHVFIWGRLQSLHCSTQKWCFSLLTFFISPVERELQWMFKSHVSCTSWFIHCLFPLQFVVSCFYWYTNGSTTAKHFCDISTVFWIFVLSTQVFCMCKLKMCIKMGGWKCTCWFQIFMLEKLVPENVCFFSLRLISRKNCWLIFWLVDYSTNCFSSEVQVLLQVPFSSLLSAFPTMSKTLWILCFCNKMVNNHKQKHKRRLSLHHDGLSIDWF